MAARIERIILNLKNSLHLRVFLQKQQFPCACHRHTYSSQIYGPSKDDAQLFSTAVVQGILTRLTGMDLGKVFQKSKEKLEPPTYRLLGDTKLKELEEEAKLEAAARLQMPPVLAVREEICEVLDESPELKGLDESKFLFTDIAYDLKDRDRFIVVREPNGVLRKATCSERDRALQIYFPCAERQLVPPNLFNDENIHLIFTQDRHQSLLDRACVQFEPDALEFIKIHEKTYEDIDNKESYTLLWSTRHYGGLVFYLARKQRIDGLLVDMIKRNAISDAVDLVQLFTIVHPSSQSAIEVKANTLDGTDAIQVFIEHDAKKQGLLELLLQAYLNNRAEKQQVRE